MAPNDRHRLIILRPSETFATPRDALEATGIPGSTDIELKHFELPQIAVVLGKDGLPLAEVCSFLLEKAVLSKGITGDTPRTYGEALCDWLDYLDASRCGCTDASEERLGLYRLHQLAPKPRGRGQLSNSAKLRITVAQEFHRWGQRTQRMTSPLGAFLQDSRQTGSDRRSPDRRSRNPNSFLPAVDKRLPRVLTQEEIVRLFNVAPRPFTLMFRWAIATGMRRVEVCDLRLKQLPSPTAVSRQDGGLLMIDVRRKGGATKSVAVPCRLVEETNWYVVSERPDVSQDENAHVFVGNRGCISRQRLSKVFRESADAIGSTATLHHLRHTFAVNVLHSLNNYEGGGQAMNPIKCLQVLLGHSSIETTQIYLQALSMSSDAVRQALDYLYGGTVERDS